MASAEFDEEALEKRPTVQVGDPFLEKLLLEACLEAMRSGAIAGIQDMGAAGLTSSSCEMAARAGTGIELDLSLVPQREQNMTAYEMLLVGIAGAHVDRGALRVASAKSWISFASGISTRSSSGVFANASACRWSITARQWRTFRLRR